jgi:hypothetical protein
MSRTRIERQRFRTGHLWVYRGALGELVYDFTGPGQDILARSQELTSKINRAKSIGKNTSTTETERSEGEKAIQHGNDKEVLRLFQIGERA